MPNTAAAGPQWPLHANTFLWHLCSSATKLFQQMCVARPQTPEVSAATGYN